MEMTSLKSLRLNELQIRFLSGGCLFNVTLPVNFLEGCESLVPYEHLHHKFELLFIRQPGGPDLLRLIPPGCIHSAGFRSRETRMNAFQFTITLPSGPQSLEGTVAGAYLSLGKPCTLTDDFAGFSLLEEAKEELRALHFGVSEKLDALFHTLLVETARRLPAMRREVPNLPQRMPEENCEELVEDYLIHNFQRPDCCSEELAEALFVSTRQLRRLLAQHYGRTFRELLLQVRMEKAHAILKIGPVSAAQVAEQVGYQSVPAFYTAYKKYFGRAFGGSQREIPSSGPNVS